jgi:hypothetical protein
MKNNGNAKMAILFCVFKIIPPFLDDILVSASPTPKLR